MAKRKSKPALPPVTAVCHSCGRTFEMPGEDWDRNRKPWCSDCKRAAIPGGQKFQPPTKESREIKRTQSKANRRWRKETIEGESEGVVRIIKDWTPIKSKE